MNAKVVSYFNVSSIGLPIFLSIKCPETITRIHHNSNAFNLIDQFIVVFDLSAIFACSLSRQLVYMYFQRYLGRKKLTSSVSNRNVYSTVGNLSHKSVYSAPAETILNDSLNNAATSSNSFKKKVTWATASANRENRRGIIPTALLGKGLFQVESSLVTCGLR